MHIKTVMSHYFPFTKLMKIKKKLTRQEMDPLSFLKGALTPLRDFGTRY